MLGPPLLPLLMTLCWGALQGAPIDGTWELARIFRSGPAAASHTVPIDSTVYLRLTLKTMPGEWIDGRLYRRYHGRDERGKIEAGAPGGGRGAKNRGGPPGPRPPKAGPAPPAARGTPRARRPPPAAAPAPAAPPGG